MKLSSNDENKRIIFNNFFNFFATTCGLHHHKGCEYTLPDAEFPIFNSVLSTQVSENDIPTLIADMKQYYKHKKQFCWWLTCLVQPVMLASALEEHGFQRGSAFTGMVYDLNKEIIIPKKAKSILIHPISHPEQFDEWVKVLQVSFSIDDYSAAFCAKSFKQLFEDKRLQHFYVEDKGKIIATGSLFISNKISGFYNLGVLPEYRHQQIGTALKYYRLQLSQNMGAKTAILQSSEMGRPLDESIGFIPIFDFVPYFSPEQSSLCQAFDMD